VLATSANIAPCLVAADVMISDHSSAAFEFLILDRPLVRIEVPALLQQANVHPDYAALLASSADNVRTVNQAVDAVEAALASPGQRSETRRHVAADLFYRPGTASARCAAALYEVLQLEPHPSLAPHIREAAPCALSA
jgi:CDP-glycerol glycerophosphotransferase (TagB/SpsB family)